MSEGERRLAAIMFTDMVGFTIQTQKDEALAMTLLEEHRAIVRPFFPKHNGREVKTMGDAFLAEFNSALEAVRCAYDLQQSLHELNIGRPTEGKIQVRVGVHLGDVIHHQNDVYGDAVNLASRIEPLASPGGICISEQVYDHIKNKFEFPMVSLGRKELKNIGEAVEVFRVVLPWEQEKTTDLRHDKKRIAVLPFDNISPDSADEYFADGMTEELIDRLSQVKGLKVIARTSVMSYKKKEKKVSEIGKELGVGTLVKGSVRKAGNKIRVTAQLVDTNTEEHLWSSRYDKDLNDIFAVQTDIAGRIVEALPSSLIGGGASPGLDGDTTDVRAYSSYLQGRQLIYQGGVEDIRQSIGFFERALEADPHFARAYASLARSYVLLGYKGVASYAETVERSKAMVQKALAIDQDLAEAHVLLAEIAWVEDDFPKDELEAKRAIELNPSLADAYSMLGQAKSAHGYPRQATSLYETAYQLDPLSPTIIGRLGDLYMLTGRMSEAEDLWRRNLRFAPYASQAGLAELNLVKGDYARAEQSILSLERDFPDEISTLELRGWMAALKGERAVAEKTILRIEEKFREGAMVNKMVGYIRYLLGDMDSFFAAMFKDAQEHTLDPETLRYHPLFKKAREDPRYKDVLIRGGENPEIGE